MVLLQVEIHFKNTIHKVKYVITSSSTLNETAIAVGQGIFLNIQRQTRRTAISYLNDSI